MHTATLSPALPVRLAATPTPELLRLVYTSSTLREWPESDLLALLEKSRRNNERDGITGLLLYRDGNIMQLLEGPEAAVGRTFERIRGDSRHGGIMTLLRERTASRLFHDSAMGFRNLADPELPGVSGYSQFLNEFPGRPSGAPSDRAWKLLQFFRVCMR